jgi:hypothetical protein
MKVDLVYIFKICSFSHTATSKQLPTLLISYYCDVCNLSFLGHEFIGVK